MKEEEEEEEDHYEKSCLRKQHTVRLSSTKKVEMKRQIDSSNTYHADKTTERKNTRKENYSQD